MLSNRLLVAIVLLLVLETFTTGIYTVINTKNIMDIFNFNKGKDIYMSMIESLQGRKGTLRIESLLVSYLIIIFGLNHFILQPATQGKKKLNESIRDAFILGLVITGTFGTVVYSIFDKYPLSHVIGDTIYTGCMFSLITYIVLTYVK